MTLRVPAELKTIFLRIRNKKPLYFGLAAALASAGLTAVIPYIYGHLVDIAVKPDIQIQVIYRYIGAWLFLSFVGDWLNRCGARAAYTVGIEINNQLHVDLFHHLLSLPMGFHKAKKMGKVMRSASRGIDDVFVLVERTFFSFFPMLVTFCVALGILLAVEWRLCLILILAGVAYGFVSVSSIKKIVAKQNLMNQGWEKAHGDLWDSVINVATVKAATNEHLEKRKNARNFNKAGKMFKEWRSQWQEMDAWQSSIFTVSFIMVFGAGILMFRAGTLSPGKLIMFVGYVGLLTSPLTQMADQFRVAKSSFSSFQRAMRYYNLKAEKDFNGAVEKKIAGRVSFQNVSFGYRRDQLILKDISFEVEPGETVAIVGESGVGKSTMLELIGRYYLARKGRVAVDGTDVKKIKLKSLRNQIAIVPQEILLFNDTIKNNIAYGRPNATDEEIFAAARAANAHEFIERLPRKYEQMAGERGVKISTGQKQRLAIARAILRNPRILILDEATSALDSYSEKLIQDALDTLVKGRTTFIIAHRLSTIQSADKIIVLEKGKISEMGKHEQLMANFGGVYRNFWDLQTAAANAAQTV